MDELREVGVDRQRLSAQDANMPSISNAVLTVLPVSPLLEANVWPLLMVCPTRMSELLPGGAGFHAGFGMNNGTGV